jgi:hypothetical protein
VWIDAPYLKCTRGRRILRKNLNKNVHKKLKSTYVYILWRRQGLRTIIWQTHPPDRKNAPRKTKKKRIVLTTTWMGWMPRRTDRLADSCKVTLNLTQATKR